MSLVRQKIEYLFENNINFSDIHLKTGHPVRYRLPAGLSILDPADLIEMSDIEHFLEQYHGRMDYARMLESNGGHIDFSIDVDSVRFRCNLYWFEGKRVYGLAMRRLNSIIPTLEDLKLPSAVAKFADRASGLVLVTGITGSGKSTTLASLIRYINETRASNIITLEDPIEYLHKCSMSMVTQREIGTDVTSFGKGVTAAMREDPDVILVGEIRDKETAEGALHAAETGHLVFSTLHTMSAAKSVERMTDFFSGEEKEWARNVFASVLAGIVSQILVPDRSLQYRALVAEVMLNTPSVSNIIRKNNIQQLPNEIVQGSKEGMCLMNKELVKLVAANVITRETAMQYSYDPAGFTQEMAQTR